MSDMEKYGVDENKQETDGQEKQASGARKCPSCGTDVVLHGDVRICPNCGTAPYERKDSE